MNPYFPVGPFSPQPAFGPPPPYGYPMPLPSYGYPLPGGYGPFPTPTFGPFPTSPFGPPNACGLGLGRWRVVNKTFLPVEVTRAGGPPFRVWPRQDLPLAFPGDDRMVLRIYSIGNLVTLEISSGQLKASSGGEVSRQGCGTWVAYFPMASLRVTVTPPSTRCGRGGSACQKIIIEADDRGTKK
jgi:hypothetical protein